MTSSVSTATASDLPDLAKLMAQSAHDPLSIDQLLDELARPQVPMLACRDDEGLLVGYTFYRVVAEKTEIHDVAVAPNYRREGSAAGLFNR
jgi:ribosomal protein S18 acetylase RimI-like enzyme